MSTSNGFPPAAGQQGHRLMTSIVDEVASRTPDKVYALILQEGVANNYTPFTYAQLCRSVNRMAWWLDNLLGKPQESSIIAYIGNPDLRYCILPLAGMKAGHQIMMPPPSTSTEALVNLFEGVKCTTLLIGDGFSFPVDELLGRAENLQSYTLPKLRTWSHEDASLGDLRYPFFKSFEELKDVPVHINTSSGTTGLPKPLAWTNGMIATSSDTCAQAAHQGHSSTAPEKCWDLLFNTTALISFPPSWVFGIVNWLHMPLFYETTVVIPFHENSQSHYPLAPEEADAAHQADIAIDGGVYVPDVLKRLSKQGEWLRNMKRLKFVMFGGAALDIKVGNLFSDIGITVQPVYGTVETGLLNNRLADRKDWMYYRWHERDGARFDLFHMEDANAEKAKDQKNEEKLHELVLYQHDLRAPDDNSGYPKQMIFQRFPDQRCYHTKDLFTPHPSREKPDLWLYTCRTDDFISLSGLAKFNATALEVIINRHSTIDAVVIGGAGRDRPFAIVQTVESPDEKVPQESFVGSLSAPRDRVVSTIWEAFVEANSTVSERKRIYRDKIIVATKTKPIRRLGKNTIDRRRTLEDYAVDIERMYQADI